MSSRNHSDFDLGEIPNYSFDYTPIMLVGIRMNPMLVALLAWVGSALADPLAAQTQPPMDAATPVSTAGPVVQPLALAEKIERETLERMLKDDSWPRRAIAAMRLERYTCGASAQKLEDLLRDQAWQARVFAVRSLARRKISAKEDWFVDEAEPRVLRAALRCGYPFDQLRLERGVQALAKSEDLKQKMLAAELAAASTSESLRKTAQECVRTVILRMNRAEAGSLSPRLALLTGQTHIHRPLQWQQWLLKAGRGFTPQRVVTVPLDSPNVPISKLAQLDSEQFVGLENYMATLSERQTDLAICIDCTASMGAELAAAQGGVDDMMLFMNDVLSSLRMAVVAYRDRGDEFETKACEFSENIADVRTFLWQFTADGGGNHPEAVYPAMQLAFTQLQWRRDAQRVLIVVGDAPPHPGYGGPAIELAKRARTAADVTTHAIQARGKNVEHFPEIAQAGGGRCVKLNQADSLIADITGLTLGDRFEEEFREFFQVYLELCR